MLHIQLLRITGVLVQRLLVVNVAGQLLTFLSVEKARLIHVTLELCSVLGKLPPVLGVALELSHPDAMSHFGVIVHAAEANLSAFIPQEGFFVPELQGARERGSNSREK